MSHTFKTGKWSKAELAQTKELIEQGLTYEQISEKINRPVSSIKSHVEEELLLNLTDEAKHAKSAEQTLRNSPEWKEIELQLSKEEQELFVYHWKEIVAQFRNDVTHTEKLQIIDISRLEILINRVMKKIYEYIAKINDCKRQLAIEEAKDSNKDMVLISSLQQQIADYQLTLTQGLHKEHKELMERKQHILREIKGTREQRIKRLEDGKDTIQSLLAKIMTSPDFQRQLGQHMEKFRIAQHVEFHRLSDLYKYANGEHELPILCVESLGKGFDQIES